ncbi:hypothetical protein [Salinispora tropica]|uniref:hypothetical protein n=1 Tax=Salinispora tropica TaxID=168695 RepID=UPI00036ED427|nr:hypothetical protein [Salinispora tropica]
MASSDGVFETRADGFVTTGFCRDAAGIASPVYGRFTHGLHVDRAMLDDYLMYVPDPPAASGAVGTCALAITPPA